jgi:Type III secretion basal body protein I, YscI, HrpB, PscI
MPNETAALSRMNGPDDMVEAPSAAGPLSDEEIAAAGWLSETLSTPAETNATSQAARVVSPNAVANMGDAILRGLTNVSSSYMKTAGELHLSMEENGAGAPSVMGALRMHMEFTLVSTQVDVVSKCITKSEQTVEQLVKQQ